MILYAGFGGKGNSSGLVLKKINCPEEHKVLLKNSFTTAPRQIQDKILNNNYDTVVLLGSMPRIKGSSLRLETKGKSAKKSYTTNLDYKTFADELVSLGHKVIISENAGRYLCNNIYYHTLKTICYHHLKCQAIFIHIPKSKYISSHQQIAENIVKAINNLKSKERENEQTTNQPSLSSFQR